MAISNLEATVTDLLAKFHILHLPVFNRVSEQATTQHHSQKSIKVASFNHEFDTSPNNACPRFV
jgi:hypothetical protein